jgi:small subunit ribosomal protein S17
MVKKKIRNIGIEAKPPKKECKDIKCPWHGPLSLRGKIFVGEVVSDRAPKTVIVKWDYSHYIPKYERYERRNTKVAAYNPECIHANKGDVVKIAECRPLSKTKSFCVIEILRKAGEKK